MSVLDDIEAKIRTLAPDQRARLLRSLIADLDGLPDADVEAAWQAVAKRRLREIGDGAVQSVPADDVFEKARSRLKR